MHQHHMRHCLILALDFGVSAAAVLPVAMPVPQHPELGTATGLFEAGTQGQCCNNTKVTDVSNQLSHTEFRHQAVLIHHVSRSQPSQLFSVTIHCVLCMTLAGQLALW